MQTILNHPITTRPHGPRYFHGVEDDRYFVKLAENSYELETALRLRHEIFNIEFGNRVVAPDDSQLEFDSYDFKCRHLIVISKMTGETVGTYRLNSIETAHSIHGFYSSNEFTVEDLPAEVLKNGIELGRAGIAVGHRNTKVLFLLWKALLAYLDYTGKRYFFGCCSIFTQDVKLGRQAYRQLAREGYLHRSMSVVPCRNGISLLGDETDHAGIELPPLFNMYLRIGARICGPPMIDHDFGSIDFFVIFDATELTEKYQRMFSCTIGITTS